MGVYMRSQRNKRNLKNNYILNYLKLTLHILSILILICLLIFIYSSINVKKSLLNISAGNLDEITNENASSLETSLDEERSEKTHMESTENTP